MTSETEQPTPGAIASGALASSNRCRGCGALGFALSALLHGTLAASVLWLMAKTPPPMAVDDGHSVAVTLAMFDAVAGPASASGSASDETQDDAAASREQTDQATTAAAAVNEAPIPEPRPKQAPEPVIESEPLPERVPVAVAAPKPEPLLVAKPEPQPEPQPVAKPRPTPKPKPVVKPKPKPEPKPVAKPKPKPKPAPRPVAKAKPKPEPIVKPRAKPRAKPTAKAKPSTKPDATRKAIGSSRPTTRTAKGSGSSSGKGSGSDTKGRPSSSSGAVSAATKRKAESRYLSELQRAIARRRYYPQSASKRGLTGTAQVQFTIAANGRFSGIRIRGGSGSKQLDRAATTTIKRLAKFKPIPKTVGRSSWTVRVPIVYRIK